MVNKFITFSLWGDNPKYGIGAIRNAQLALKHFSDWQCIFYHDDTVPVCYLNILKDFSNTSLVKIDDDSYGMFWRFSKMFESTDVVISRDADARLSEREKVLVDHWLSSDYTYMTIRDHYNHYEFPILGGMWGKKNIMFNSAIQTSMNKYRFTKQYTIDQIFLRDVLWDKIISKTAIYGVKELGWMRETYDFAGNNFIGQTYTENDEPVYEGKIDE